MLNRTWVRILLLSLPVIFVAACILLRDFAYSLAVNVMPPCDTYSKLGFLCAGCGLTRCILAIMEGNLFLAVRSNAAVFLLFVCVVLLYIEILLLSFGKDVRILPRKPWVWVIVGILAAVYFVLRNFFDVLAPLPLE